MVYKVTIADSVILFTVVIMFIIMMLVTLKVFRLIRCYDRRLLLMLIFLDLTLICNNPTFHWK
jgi:hypothetical protein